MRRLRFAPLWLILSGVLTALPPIFPVLAPLGWVSMIPAGMVLLREATDGGRRHRLLRLWGLGLCFFLPYFCLGYHWFVALYPLSFTGMSETAAAVVVLLGCVGLGLLHGGLTALAFPLCGILFRAPLCRRFPWMRLPLAALVWCIAEWAQTTGWMGVPWVRLALGQTAWLPVLQVVSLGGSALLAFAIVLCNLCFAEAILSRKWRDRRILAALLAFGIPFAAGSGLYLADEAAAKARPTVTAAALQGNVSSHEKWQDEMLSDVMTRYTDLTVEAVRAGASLIVWPETAIPYTLRRYLPMIDYLEQLADASGADLLVGAFSEDETTQYNTMYTVRPEAGLLPGGYSKRHLVPFGEYLPMADFFETYLPPLAELRMNMANIGAGDAAAVRDLGGVRVGSLICFDSIYATAARDAARHGANLLAISTNDSWFSDSAAVRQHNAQAVLRAVETGRSVIRAANTGISSAITPRGNVVASLPPLVAGQVTATLELRDSDTLYTLLGDWVVHLALASLGVTLASYPLQFACSLVQKKRKPLDNHMTA